jgi:hypothetical protein
MKVALNRYRVYDINAYEKANSSQGGDAKPRAFKRQPGYRKKVHRLESTGEARNPSSPGLFGFDSPDTTQAGM